jgi:periplasmic copper chaperone A
LRCKAWARGRLFAQSIPRRQNGEKDQLPDPDESFFTHLHAEEAMANVTVSPGRAGLVEIEIRIENADEQPLRAKAVSVTLGNSEKGFEVTTDAEQISNDQWRVRMSAPVSSLWSLGLGIKISAFDKINVVSPILIR